MIKTVLKTLLIISLVFFTGCSSKVRIVKLYDEKSADISKTVTLRGNQDRFKVDGRQVFNHKGTYIKLLEGSHAISFSQKVPRYFILPSIVERALRIAGAAAIFAAHVGRHRPGSRLSAALPPSKARPVMSTRNYEIKFDAKSSYSYLFSNDSELISLKEIPGKLKYSDNKIITIDYAQPAGSANDQLSENHIVTVEDGNGRRIYRDMPWSGPIVSPDGKRVAFFDSENDRFVIDGDETEKYSSTLQNTPLFSQDGNHVFWGGKKKDGWSVSVDGKESKKYGHIVPGTSVFSPDSKRVAFFVQEKGNPLLAGKWHFNIDGKEQGEFDDIPLIRHPDPRRGSKLPHFIDVRPVAPVIFSPDSQRVAYEAKIGRNWVVFDNYEKVGEYERVAWQSIVFSPDSKRLSFVAGDKGRSLVVIDGVVVGRYDRVISKIVFSGDSKRTVFIAGESGKEFIVVDGKKGMEYDFVVPDSLTFSPDSKRVVFSAIQSEKWMVVLDGMESSRYNEILLGTPRFSSDSKHVVFAAKKEKKFIISVDGVESQNIHKIDVPFDGSRYNTLTFDEDENEVLFFADNRQLEMGYKRVGDTVIDKSLGGVGDMDKQIMDATIHKLLSPNYADQNYAARIIYRKYMQHPEIIKLVNQKLLGIFTEKSTNPKRKAKAVGMMCKVLGASGNHEYAATLERVGKNAPYRRERSYANRNLSVLNESIKAGEKK